MHHQIFCAKYDKTSETKTVGMSQEAFTTYHSWSSSMCRNLLRYSLGSSNWDGSGNMDS